jgi:simple sugar transport system permease protein
MNVPTQPTEKEPATGSPPKKEKAPSRLLWPILALVLLLLFNALFTPGFMHIEVRDGRLFGSIIDIANRGAPVMLLTLGMTLVLATGGVDLSVGAVMAIAGAVAAILITERNASLPVVLGGALAASLAAGVWNGVLVAWLGIQPIVATLILMVSGRGIAQLLTGGQIPTFHNASISFLGQGALFGLPFSITVVAVMTLIIWFLTRRTALGLFIEAVGDNETASRYAGINPRTVKVFVYTFCGLCAGVAGLIEVANITAADANNLGLNRELDAILAAVIGGTALTGGRFSLPGSLIGALIIQTLNTTILARGVQVELTLVVKAIVVLAVCLLQSDEFRRMFVRSRRIPA